MLLKRGNTTRDNILTNMKQDNEIYHGDFLLLVDPIPIFSIYK